MSGLRFVVDRFVHGGFFVYPFVVDTRTGVPYATDTQKLGLIGGEYFHSEVGSGPGVDWPYWVTPGWFKEQPDFGRELDIVEPLVQMADDVVAWLAEQDPYADLGGVLVDPRLEYVSDVTLTPFCTYRKPFNDPDARDGVLGIVAAGFGRPIVGVVCERVQEGSSYEFLIMPYSYGFPCWKSFGIQHGWWEIFGVKVHNFLTEEPYHGLCVYSRVTHCDREPVFAGFFVQPEQSHGSFSHGSGVAA